MRKKIIYVCSLSALCVAVAAGWLYASFYGSAVDERVKLVIEAEEYAAQADKVKAVIRHDMAFDIYAKRITLGRGIEAGEYEFEAGMSVIDIARRLKFGNDGTTRLTINNARTPEQLAAKIASQIDADSLSVIGALRNEELIAEMGFESAEAMFSIFLPNTYEVYANISPEALVRRMKRESDRFWSSEERQQALARAELTPYEAMTLASIVHEETTVRDEMARIAGVYINRLRRGMPLQADPTVKYAVGDPALKRILYRHLEVDSPYNTYLYAGLPPTPIAMPDMAAIEAVLCYEEHDYYYFCARAEMDGRHNFARTHREHERNAAAYHRALTRLRIR